METLEAILDKPLSLWDTPRRTSVPSGLCSLLMIHYRVENLFKLLEQGIKLDARLRDRAVPPGGKLLDSDRKELLGILIDDGINLLTELSELEMLDPVNLVTNFHTRVRESADNYTCVKVQTEWMSLKESIESKLDSRLFMFIPSADAEYLHQDRLFGANVFVAFPDARRDLTEAGNAFALSLFTATVFHLMRVTEYGLRRLAKRLRVDLTHKGNRCPVEFADWDKVITGIKAKIGAVRGTAIGPKRQAQLELYSSAADHCEYMKDIWRNNTAHTRKPYTRKQAEVVLEQIESFMQFLADSFK